MHNFVVHSNESACRKSGRLGLDQVYFNFCSMREFIVLLDGTKERVSVNERIKCIRVRIIKIVQSFAALEKLEYRI